jgi:hypothetical protein
MHHRETPTFVLEGSTQSPGWPSTNSVSGLQPDWFDIREMICSPSEAAGYNSVHQGGAKTGSKCFRRLAERCLKGE